jgi:isoquinoline 1-oxidoreductase beta subunit
VKVVWTREDDIRGGYYRSLFVHRLRGGLRNGKVAAWASTSVGQSILKGSPFEAMIQNGIDPTSVEGMNERPYDIADFRCDLHTTQVGVPVLWWRSVGHSHTGYAVECFIDELLEAAGQDPVAGRLALMGGAPRSAGVLRAVAELARCSGPGPANGRARGVAVVESFGSYIAQIAEVSAGTGGELRVHKVWCAVDCGAAFHLGADDVRIHRHAMSSVTLTRLGTPLSVEIGNGAPISRAAWWANFGDLNADAPHRG